MSHVHTAYEIVNASGSPWGLLVCDHASNDIPRELGTLGLDRATLGEHIAWDIGAADLVRGLSTELNLPAVLSRYSRLVVDCNRRLDEPTAFPVISDQVVVPGNESLGPAARRWRADRCYWPYHAAIRDRLDAARRARTVPALIAVHSFTPRMDGFTRPWHVGVLWDRDDRISAPLLAALRGREGLVIGDNEPYSGHHPANHTVDFHAASAGLAHVGIEVRQDLISDAAGVASWVAILREVLAPIIAGLVRSAS